MEKESSIPTGQKTGWAPEPVRTQRLEEKSFAFFESRNPFIQFVVRHYTD
jgi:hypothetical protein